MGCCKSKSVKVTAVNNAPQDVQTNNSRIPQRLDEPRATSSPLLTQLNINVLLLGESGVGKSTFINALVNYLKFDTLEQAASSGELIALMPVSFVMTVGDDFQERIVTFGGQDFNEDFNHPGQSVTQRCKSYSFNIGTRHKLNLIDTPGIGDTRGLDQDDLNMQHIFSYINNLSHLNAICILLKPNESKLNVVIRSYFSQLIGFLGENARDNIVFCFTNTRSTFYSPGDTAPLLRQMLNNIPFDKSNTFCFDSESFRYLIARLNGIKFDDYQKSEYKQSWITSVDESNRFLQYICSELKPYAQINWQSVEHARFRINRLIRPLLETIRNILRNSILIIEKSTQPQIELRITAVSQSSTICTSDTCKRIPQKYSGFWILPDDIHIYIDACTKCSCSRKRHIDVGYRLDYELSDVVHKLSIDELQVACVEFGYFFLSAPQSSTANDPIFTFLDGMVKEEYQLSQKEGSECLNKRLYKRLTSFKDDYEQRRNTLMKIRKSFDLASTYEFIQKVNGMDLFR